MDRLTLLHVSDLHYEPKNEFDRSIVVDALLKDIREARSAGTQFDAVIFSGDLVQSGEDPVAFEKVKPAFIVPLMEAAALPVTKLILCPGNHDINRKAGRSTDERVASGSIARLSPE